MKELELKHLAPYLPYGLKLQYVVREKVEQIGIMKSISHNEDETNPTRVSISAMYNEEHIWMFKPLLRPLSQLTQEIEHNGENFVPLEVIARMIEPEYILIDKSTFDFNVINESIGYDQVFQLRYKTDYDNYKMVVMLNFHEKEKCFWHTERIIPFSCIEKLLEWHFDIHNLIKNNLAIEIK